MRTTAAICGFFASTLVGAIVHTPAAWAQKPKRVVVEQFSGTGADKFRIVVSRILVKGGVDIISDKKVATTEADLGLLQVSDNYAAVSKELKAGAFIDGTVTGKKKLTARLRVKGPDGAPMGNAIWQAKKLPALLKAVNATLSAKLATIFTNAAGGKQPEAAAAPAPVAAAAPAPADDTPPPPKAAAKKKKADDEEPAPAEEKVAAADGEKAAPADADEPTVSEEAEPEKPSKFHKLDLAAGAHVYGRTFSYNQNAVGRQQEYRLPVVPAPAISVEYFFTPLIGAQLTAEYSVALISQDSAGNKYKTSSMAYSIGPRLRYNMGSTELTGGVSYAMNSFKVVPETGDPTAPQVAGVEYKQVKVGGAARIAVTDKVAVVGGGNYLHLLGFGELQSDTYFPYATGRGGEGFAGLAFALPWMKGLEARGTLDLRRYVFDMHSQDADMRIAGGAVDQYVGVNILLGYRK
jgi:hypothetical protein